MRRLVIPAILLVCLAGAPAAKAGAPRSFYGVMAASDPTSTEISRMGAGRVGTLRINMVWGQVQPSPGAPLDWSHYDSIIGEAAMNGIRVLPTIYSSPTWAAPRPSAPPSSNHMADFQAFVRAAAQRYGSNGIFWTLHPLTPKLPITDWQIWNEVNSPSFWYPKPNPRQYVNLVRVARSGLQSGDPSARVVLAGLFPTPRVKNGIDLSKYLPALYRQGARNLFDAVAVHPYASTPRISVQDVRQVRGIMAKFGDKRKPVWVTEVGWATGGLPRSALTTTPARQAANLRQTFKLMAANRKRLRIAAVVWYSWRDVPGGIWFDHTGLFTGNFTPKPAWSAFVGLTGGIP